MNISVIHGCLIYCWPANPCHYPSWLTNLVPSRLSAVLCHFFLYVIVPITWVVFHNCYDGVFIFFPQKAAYWSVLCSWSLRWPKKKAWGNDLCVCLQPWKGMRQIKGSLSDQHTCAFKQESQMEWSEQKTADDRLSSWFYPPYGPKWVVDAFQPSELPSVCPLPHGAPSWG